MSLGLLPNQIDGLDYEESSLVFWAPFISRQAPIAHFPNVTSVSINDSVDIELGETKIFGRTDPIYHYGGSFRKITASIKLASKTTEIGTITLQQVQNLMTTAYPQYDQNRKIAAPPIHLVKFPARYKIAYYGYLDKVEVQTGDATGPVQVTSNGIVIPYVNTLTFTLRLMHLNTIDGNGVVNGSLIGGEGISFGV